MKISACIIARNEEENLPRCLKSLSGVADEIIVVDSGSADRTPQIARELGATLVEHSWEGYAQQKKYAMSQARHEWILSLDADEELSPELRDEIIALKPAEPNANGFSMSRVVYFDNRWIRFGDWYPDVLVRLFRKTNGTFGGGAVHERVQLKGTCRRLDGEIYHYTYKDRDDWRRRIEDYATLWAQSAFQEGKKACICSAYTHALWKIFRGFVLKGGWRGGKLGWEISLETAREVFLKYRKLAELHRRSSHE